MERAEAASPPAAASTAAKPGKTERRPDFTLDPRYQRLVPLMAVDSTTALNELRLEAFRQKAAELHNQQPEAQTKKPGSFTSWKATVDALLQFADSAASPAKQTAAPTPAPEVQSAAPTAEPVVVEAVMVEEDIDEEVADALQAVEALLAGDVSATELGLDEQRLAIYEKAIARHTDKLDAAVRRKFEQLTDSDLKVADVVDMIKVAFSVSNALISHHPMVPLTAMT